MQGKQGIVIAPLQMPLHGTRQRAPFPPRQGAGVKALDSMHHRFEKRQCLLSGTAKADRQLDVVALEIYTQATIVRRIRGLKQEACCQKKLHWQLHRLAALHETPLFNRCRVERLDKPILKFDKMVENVPG